MYALYGVIFTFRLDKRLGSAAHPIQIPVVATIFTPLIAASFYRNYQDDHNAESLKKSWLWTSFGLLALFSTVMAYRGYGARILYVIFVILLPSHANLLTHASLRHRHDDRSYHHSLLALVFGIASISKSKRVEATLTK